MLSLDLLMYQRIRERLEEELLTRIEMLSNGSATTLEEYKNQVGYIKGIKDTLIWAHEINDTLVGRNEKAR